MVLVTLLVAALIYVAEGQSWNDPFFDLRGKPYCSTIKPTCCNSRVDDCSVPILGTLCYCDEFCSTHKNPDCCPDYDEVCRGIPPPPPPIRRNRCWFNDRFYEAGERLKVNCKDCTCVDMSNRMEIQCEQIACITDDDIVTQLNEAYRSRRQTWEPYNYTMFHGVKLEEGFSQKLGTFHSRKKVRTMKPLLIVPSRNLPRSFDARQKWPDFITGIQDQGWCAASWVYSTVGVASDRWAIMSRGKLRENLSFQHLLGCNSRNQRGCKGGHLTRAWQFIKLFGLVKESCYRFTGSTTRCTIPKHKKALMAKCEATPRIRQPLYRVTPVYRISGEGQIKDEIYKNGPVQATMRVTRDLFLYKNGVYTCPRRSGQSGFHSVRIIGWGEEEAGGKMIPYWLVANSWGEGWGENGFFKIRRGTNECEIEDFVLGVWADTSKHSSRVDYDYNQLSNNIYPAE